MTNDPVVDTVIYIIVFFVSVFITRAIFSIGAIVRNLKAHTALLYHIAKAQGVDEKIIKAIAVQAEVFVPTENQLVKPDSSAAGI